MYTVKGDTPGECWAQAMALIEKHGWDITTEHGQLTREVRNLIVEIQHPDLGWPIKGTGWNTGALDKYAIQFFNPDKQGFDYSYGERLFRGNQLAYIMDTLAKSKVSRRAIATTWVPKIDHHADHTPCLQLIEFLYRENKLHMTAVFRSNDIRDAWPQNVYGLNTVLKRICAYTSMTPGTLTTHSVSAHYYKY